MKKQALYHAEAKRLYCQELLSFAQIAQQIPVSERTLYKWASADQWSKARQDAEREIEAIGKDNRIITRLLGKRIIEILKNGSEPSATLSNAYARSFSSAVNMKRLEVETETVQSAPVDSRTPEQIIQSMLL